MLWLMLLSFSACGIEEWLRRCLERDPELMKVILNGDKLEYTRSVRVARAVLWLKGGVLVERCLKSRNTLTGFWNQGEKMDNW